MKKLFIVSIAFVICWAKPDVSHLANNGYLPPEKTNSYKDYAPTGSPSTPLQQTQRQSKPRHSQIESIQPSIHIASFSIRTEVPLSQIDQQSYYTPATTQSSAIFLKDSYDYNPQQTNQQNPVQQSFAAPASTPQTYAPAAPVINSYSQYQTYSAPVSSSFQQYNVPPTEVEHIPAVSVAGSQSSVTQDPVHQTYAPASAPQQTYVPPVQQVLQPPAISQQAQPQQLYLPPATEQQPFTPPAIVEQKYIPPAPVQQNYEQPASIQQTYVPPTPAQPSNVPAATVQQNEFPISVEQTVEPPVSIQPSYASPAPVQQNEPSAPIQQHYKPTTLAQQSYNAPAQAQQSEQRYLPPATEKQISNPPTTQVQVPSAPVQQPYETPKPAQQSYLPPTPPQQAYETPKPAQQSYVPPTPPQQAYETPKPAPQSYVPPTPAQQAYETPKPAQQSYVPPTPAQQAYETPKSAQQSYVPPVAVQQNEPQHPVQQTYLPPGPIEQSFIPPQFPQQNYESSTSEHDTFTPTQQAQQDATETTFDSRRPSEAYLPPTPAQQAYDHSLNNQQSTQQASVQARQNQSPASTTYLPPVPAQATSSAQQFSSPKAAAQQSYVPPSDSRQNSAQNSYSSAATTEPLQQKYSTPAATTAQQFYLTPQLQQAPVEPPTLTATYGVPYNYNTLSGPNSPQPTPEVYTPSSTAPIQSQQIVEPAQGSHNYNNKNFSPPMQAFEPRPAVTSVENSFNYNPAQSTYAYEVPASASDPQSYSSVQAQPAAQHYTPAQAVSNVDNYFYKPSSIQQSGASAATTNQETPKQSSLANGSYNFKPTTVPQTYASPSPPAAIGMFHSIPSSLLQPQGNYNYKASSSQLTTAGASKDTDFQPSFSRHQASSQRSESINLNAVQPALKTDTSLMYSKAAQAVPGMGTEYGANGGYIYRKN